MKAGIVASVLLIASVASAQSIYSTEHPAVQRVPDTGIAALVGGSLLLSTYIPSAIVAGTSPYDPDQNLWFPVVGPWMDLAERAACHGTCGTEAGYKALLILDGVAQDIGALSLVVGIVTTGLGVGEPPVRSALIRPTTMHFGRGGIGGGIVGVW